MLQDMFKIQAALGGSSGQGGFGMYRDQEEKPVPEEETLISGWLAKTRIAVPFFMMGSRQ